MNIIPLWIKLAACAILIAALAAWFRFYQHQLREEGRDEVRAEWKAANDAAEKVATAAAKRAEIDYAAREAQRDKDFGALRARNAALASRLAAASVDPAILAGLRESVRAANHQPSAGGVEAGATSVTGTAVDDWFQTVAKLYSRCRDQVIGWIEWDNNRVTH